MLESLAVEKRVLLWELMHIGLPRIRIPVEMFNYLKPTLVCDQERGTYRIESFFAKPTLAVRLRSFTSLRRLMRKSGHCGITLHT